MKINYQETTSDLLTRINIHDKYGGRNIDEWMLDLLKLQKGSKILDAACGAGKQVTSFYNFLNGDCDITGGDVSTDLLNQARQSAAANQIKAQFVDLNFNKKFPFESDQFDLLSCCFAIYYSEDIHFTFSEMSRVLKPGGRLFTSGPMPDNKKMFYEIIREATKKTIPPMPGSSRYGSEILHALKRQFPSVEVTLFENPLTFDTVEPFIDYTRASISEDRKLWNSIFDTKDDFENVMQAIEAIAKKWLARDGKLVMTKVVGGFVATK
jgi:ubiquinone/menaquinone biosynthesis C-methylase UbiE